MESRKRRLPQAGLERRVRARAEPEPDVDGFEDHASSAAPSEEEIDEHESGSESESDNNNDSGDAEENAESSEEDEEEEDVSVDASKVSFGALAKAQAMMRQSGRRNEEDKESDTEVRGDGVPQPRQSSKKEKPPSRSSKHAPMEVSSKRPVSRKREIIPVKKVQYRDPRFDPLVVSRSAGQSKVDDDRARKAYSFIDDYRDDEVRQLKVAIKKAKTPAEKEELQRAVMSMESRKKTREKKDKERAVVEEHRRREKELVKEGKKARPFYLKKSEQKKQFLLGQFAGMSEKQRDKTIEKRRKKLAGKEKKEMPLERRGREDR